MIAKKRSQVLIILFPRLKTMIFGYDILIKDVNNLIKSVEKIKIKSTREPGGSLGGERIRKLIFKKKFLTNN